MTKVNSGATTTPVTPTRNESSSTTSPSSSSTSSSSTAASTASAASSRTSESNDARAWRGENRYEVRNRTPATVNTTANSATITASNRDDRISVTNRRGGGLNVSVNGNRTQLTAAQAQNLTINAGDGNDRVYVAPNVRQGVTINGGAGNDRIAGGRGNDQISGGTGNDSITGGRGNDRISGGSGNDRISGGRGRDTLYGNNGNDRISGGRGDDYINGGAGNDRLSGGRGRDVMYGLSGNDRMYGGSQGDYIDGGTGNDRLVGGRGNDQLMGGRGNDRLYGGSGNDVLAGGHGVDRYSGGRGGDQYYYQTNDRAPRLRGRDRATVVDMSTRNAAGNEPGSSIGIGGSSSYRAQVRSDIDALRSVPAGRDLLTAIDNTGKSTQINPTTDGNSASGAGYRNPNFTVGTGTNATTNYNPNRTHLGGNEAWSARPPVVGLYHELVHNHDDMTGRSPASGQRTDGVQNYEQSAVGLPIDHDQDEAGHGHSTARIQPNSYYENLLRHQLGLPIRTEY